MVSIKVNRHLQTINNYFTFSLACADLIIGAFSMNLFTVYIIFGYWPLGQVVCELWIIVDYVVNNASGMNLLLISFDRYLCVTKPLEYPMRRTTKIAGMMVASAWVIPFILWAPVSLLWQVIVGEWTVSEGECYVSFLKNPTVTFGIAVVAFYLLVIIIVILYVRISRASKSRIKEDKKVNREKMVTHTILAVLLGFTITWTPYIVLVFINNFCSTCIPSAVWTIAQWIFYINSAINPVCYALCNKNFKKTFKYLLFCQYKNINAK
ncbi:muscarinic acetylcholine receptor M2-like [Stegostoma tigrinum]|uniref:muscarinic acetylcholine receptor M2-like n=1 Tax=Stegostoma tigrinum TaxID=3053191 RepID=UPI00202B76B1|nr:muscarinic acetylcholine receptor M2-like [Stegostoma tigrinum]